MWYGRLATTSYGGCDQVGEVLVEHVALDSRSRPARRASIGRRASARSVAQSGQAAVDLDRRHRGAAVEQRRGQDPEAGADLEDAPARAGRRLGEDRLEHVAVDEVVLRERVAGAQARRARSVVAGPSRRVDGAATVTGSAASPAGSDGLRVEVEAGPLAGREPARAGRADHRRVVGAQAGPRHDERDAERRRLGGDPRRAARGSRPRRRRRRSSARRSRARRAASWSRARRRPSPGSPRRARRPARSGSGAVGLDLGECRRSVARPPSMIRRAAVLRPLKQKSYVSPSQARGNARSRRSRRRPPRA